MKKMRKGFTLVELLIVIAILGALSASMVGSAGNATAKAKAAAIVGNIDVSKTAAALYYYDNNDASDFAAKKTKDVLGDSKYVRNWSDFATGSIKYTSNDATYPNWHVYVDFTADGASADILTFLKNAKGYSGVTKGIISVDLITGKVKDKADS